MKKAIYFILAAIFFLLGTVGLVLPVIPQVPFFVAAFYFASRGAPGLKGRVRHTKLYRKYLQKYVRGSRALAAVFGEKTEEEASAIKRRKEEGKGTAKSAELLLGGCHEKNADCD